MDNVTYFSKVLDLIELKDSLHASLIRKNIKSDDYFYYLINIVCGDFIKNGIAPAHIVGDYLSMIADIRSETALFLTSGKYSCKNQAEAYEKFYSNPEIMGYYMNALLLSNILWRHHFDLLSFFNDELDLFIEDGANILDVGSGHGLLTKIVVDSYDIDLVDVVDTSQSSLNMAKSIIDNKAAKYRRVDAMSLESNDKYDLIILGEILEHLDNPLELLKKMRRLLKDSGVIWATIPMNAPAIDHVYLFRSEDEVFNLLHSAGLIQLDILTTRADNLTSIVGVFCGKL